VVEGIFLLKEKKVDVADMDVRYISKSLSYLIDSLKETKRDLKRITIYGENKNVRIYINGEGKVLGVVNSNNTNVPLLDLISSKFLQDYGKPEPVFIEKDLEEVCRRIPTFKAKKKYILENVSERSRRVLEYVDGTKKYKGNH